MSETKKEFYERQYKIAMGEIPASPKEVTAAHEFIASLPSVPEQPAIVAPKKRKKITPWEGRYCWLSPNLWRRLEESAEKNGTEFAYEMAFRLNHSLRDNTANFRAQKAASQYRNRGKVGKPPELSRLMPPPLPLTPPKDAPDTSATKMPSRVVKPLKVAAEPVRPAPKPRPWWRRWFA